MLELEDIKPEDAERILKEETPRRLDRLRRQLQNLKDYLREQSKNRSAALATDHDYLRV